MEIVPAAIAVSCCVDCRLVLYVYVCFGWVQTTWHLGRLLKMSLTTTAAVDSRRLPYSPVVL